MANWQIFQLFLDSESHKPLTYKKLNEKIAKHNRDIESENRRQSNIQKAAQRQQATMSRRK